MNPQLNRRRALGALLAATAATVACQRVATAVPGPADELRELEQRYSARIGLFAVDLNSAATVRNRADERFSMCSTFKAYAAARVLQLVDAGRLRLDTPVPVAESDVVTYSPVTGPRAGSAMALSEVCAAALIHSDNTAGNLLLRQIGGPPAITAFARSVGDDQSRLDRWETELNSAVPGDPRDTTTPRALCHGYREVLTGRALSPGATDQLLNWMRENVTSGKRFRAALPSGWTSADKTGGGDYGSTNDSGLLIGPAGQRLVVTVLTRSLDDRKDAGPFNDAIADAVRLTLRRLGHAT